MPPAMPGPVLYSANPWIAHQLALQYLNGVHFAWCSECYDPNSEAPTSAAAAIAPSSSPAGIIARLKADCHGEDIHSDMIVRYRKTLKRLATGWRGNGTISDANLEEIRAVLKSSSWKMWHPLLYVIPRKPIEDAGRLIAVPHAKRASFGPEYQITDLKPDEFDIIRM
jgi:hypothetical protein